MKHLSPLLALFLSAIAFGSTPSPPILEGTASGGTSAHAYFESLVANVAHHDSWEGRSNAEVFPTVWSQPAKYDPSKIDYDASEDAMRSIFAQNGANAPGQWGPGREGGAFPVIGPGTGHSSIVYYWETKWDIVWSQKDGNGDVGGMETHKEFILLSDENGSLTDERTVEIRTDYDGVPDGQVGRVDARDYGLASGMTSVVEGPGDSYAPISTEYAIFPEIWNYYWARIDFVSETMSLWVGDENRSAVKVYDEIDVIFDSQLQFNGFIFRHNSSQSRIGPPTSIWNRYLAILTDLSESQVQTLVNQR